MEKRSRLSGTRAFMLISLASNMARNGRPSRWSESSAIIEVSLYRAVPYYRHGTSKILTTPDATGLYMF